MSWKWFPADAIRTVISGVLWFGGHRPVKDGKYLLRQDGTYLQLHNPNEMNVAIVVPEKKFNPEIDIKSVL